MEEITTNNNQIHSKQEHHPQINNHPLTEKYLPGSLDQLELDEINKILSSFSSNEQSNNNLVTSSTNFDWLNNLFTDPQIKSIFLQQSHVRTLLIYQSLYYLATYYTLYSERLKEKPTCKATTQSTSPPQKHKQQQPFNPNNNNNNNNELAYNTVTSSFNSPTIKVGVIGCGNIGSALLKELIDIKDKKRILMKIYVSTRRPDNVSLEIMSKLDEDVEIFLNNEKVFTECDVIFLCIQPHQLNLLNKEIHDIYTERIERLNKRKYKLYPLIISFLAATPIEVLLNDFFTKDSIIVRTKLTPRTLKTRKIDITLTTDKSSPIKEKENKVNVHYVKESYEQLIKRDNLDFVNNWVGLLCKACYTVGVKSKGNPNERINAEIKEISNVNVSVVLGEEIAEKYKEVFSCKDMKFDVEENQSEVIKEINGKVCEMYLNYLVGLLDKNGN